MSIVEQKLPDGLTTRYPQPNGLRRPSEYISEGSESEQMELRWILKVLKARAFEITLWGVAGVIFAIGYIVFVPAQYETTVKLMVSPKYELSRPDQAGLVPPTPIETIIQSEIEVLRSPRLAEAVIREFDLWGTTLSQSDTLTQKAIEEFINRLKVERLGISSVVEVRYVDGDPARAVAVLNALAREYIAEQIKSKTDKHDKAIRWLEQKAAELREQVQLKADAVAQNKSAQDRQKIGQQTLVDREITDVMQQTIVLREEISEAETKLQTIEGVPRDVENIGKLEKLLNSPVLKELRDKYDHVAAEGGVGLSNADDPVGSVYNADPQLTELGTVINQEVENAILAARSELERSRLRLSSLDEQLVKLKQRSLAQNQEAIKVAELERELQATTTVYGDILTRLKKFQTQQVDNLADAEILTSPRHPVKPSHPKPLIILSISLISGLAVGAVVSFARELHDPVIRSAKDLEVAVGKPVIAVVPSEKQLISKRRRLTRSRVGMDSAQQSLPFIQSILDIKRVVDQTNNSRNATVIALFSVEKGDGKTTLATNLANCNNVEGQRTLLIDCDFSDLSHTKKKTPRETDSIVVIAGEPLSLCAPRSKQGSQSYDFCAASALKDLNAYNAGMNIPKLSSLLVTLREQYDRIIIDTTALSESSSAWAVLDAADLAIMIVKSNSTTYAEALSAIRRVPGQKLLGAVLNCSSS